MRIFIIGNTKIGLNWVGRLLEELSGMVVSHSDVGSDYDNSAVLQEDAWYDEKGIVICHEASRQNLDSLITKAENDDYLVVVGRPIEDYVCECVEGEGLEGMTFEEITNFILEKHPFMLDNIGRDWKEYGVKVFSEKAVNVNYADLCLDLKKVLISFIEKFHIVVEKSKMEHVLEFCGVESLVGIAKEYGCGRVLLDTDVQRKVQNVKQKLRRK